MIKSTKRDSEESQTDFFLNLSPYYGIWHKLRLDDNNAKKV